MKQTKTNRETKISTVALPGGNRGSPTTGHLYRSYGNCCRVRKGPPGPIPTNPCLPPTICPSSEAHPNRWGERRGRGRLRRPGGRLRHQKGSKGQLPGEGAVQTQHQGLRRASGGSQEGGCSEGPAGCVGAHLDPGIPNTKPGAPSFSPSPRPTSMWPPGTQFPRL